MKPDKYFLCFGFDNFCEADLQPFHVTMIYFGELSSEKLEAVKKCLEDFFNTDPFFDPYSHSLAFWVEAWFGPNSDVRVLLPTDNINLGMFKAKWTPLREQLEKLVDYKGYPFNPHLTTPLSMFKGRINSLFLCKNNYQVIDGWDLE
jgi:2'-5' RNA ligase